MRDPFVQEKTRRAREHFVNSTNPDDICRLASSYRDGDPCKIFRPPKHGSFNACWFVEFEPPAGSQEGPTKWVVRVPIPARSPWPDESVEVEVATMR